MSERLQIERGASNALPASITPLPKIIFTDVDDTLTWHGRLPVDTFFALHRLQEAGFTVVPVTGASAGWCDCLIKTWPIQHVIGENGALGMQKNQQGVVSTRFVKSTEQVETDLDRLKLLGSELSKRFPQIRLTQDQPFRLTDIAFDIGQAVSVPESITRQAMQWLKTQNVHARRSSIHINVWLGVYSKSSAAMDWLNQRNLSKWQCLFIGDSPNDESMFEHFPVTVGVANIKRYLADMEHAPTYITGGEGGYGFVDLADLLLKTQKNTATEPV